MKNSLLLSLDIGDRYIGYAIFQSPNKIPVESGALKGEKAELREQILALIAQNDIISCVVGIPFNLSDGAVSKQGDSILEFCKALKLPEEITIFFVDESFTTSETEKVLAVSSAKKRRKYKTGGEVDARSAEAIGRRYLTGPPMYHIYRLEDLAH